MLEKINNDTLALIIIGVLGLGAMIALSAEAESIVTGALGIIGGFLGGKSLTSDTATELSTNLSTEATISTTLTEEKGE